MLEQLNIYKTEYKIVKKDKKLQEKLQSKLCTKTVTNIDIGFGGNRLEIDMSPR